MEQSRTMRFSADVRHLASVRDFAVAAAEDLGVAVDRDDLAVVVGELAANAAVHQESEAAITLSVVADAALRVEVEDHDPHVPAVVNGEPWDVEGHRGLFLVEALSAEWGVEPLQQGKRIWAVLPPAHARSTG